ncbi:MAG: alpha/beta hydrolase [Acidimicrobiales bacterium]
MDRTPERTGPGSPRRLSRRALLGAGALGATAWTVNRSTGLLGWLSGIDAAGASSSASTAPSATTGADPATTSTTAMGGATAAADAGTTSVAPLVAPGAAAELVFTPPRATRAFSGLLVRPGADQRSTAIVLVHGGGATGGSQSDSVAWSDWYRDHGYLTFSIDYRLVDPAVDTGIYPIPEQNTKAAVQYLRMHAADLGIDRVVVQGHSAGARLGGIVATTSDLPAFAGREVWSGVSDRIDGFIGFYGYYDGVQYEPVAYYGGTGVAPSTAVSTGRAPRATGPVYLLHGDADSIVGVNRTHAFADALEAAGADVVLEVVPGADHAYDGYGSSALTPIGLETASRLAAWLERTI